MTRPPMFHRAPWFAFNRVSALVFIFQGIGWGLGINARAQNPVPDLKTQSQRKKDSTRPAKVYEDEYVRIPIPHGWKVLKVGSPDDPSAAHPPAVAGTFIPEPGKGILIESKGYTLTLAYRTGHASPIIGGRIIEVFDIPWLQGIDDGWACSTSMLKVPQRANHGLELVNLVLDGEDSHVQEFCGIQKDGTALARCWFAGYFTTADEEFFFDSQGAGCPEKAYTLTSTARTPAELPAPNDLALRKIIGEAIDIVASIRYKRCPPARKATSP